MDVEEYVKRKVKPIFDRVLKEMPENRVSVGEVGFKRNYVFYQPHNCRLYFDYVKPVKPTFGSSVVVKNSSELMFKDDFMGCRVTVKRSTVEIINKIDLDKRYLIYLDGAAVQVRDIIVEKVKQGVQVLRELIRLYGGSSQFQLVNLVVQDNKVESEVFVDSIPIKSKFRNEVVKKVYGAGNVEFSDPSFFANYLVNQAALMKDFSVDRWCRDNISVLEDVFRLEGMIRLMSPDNRALVSKYLFERFGGLR